MSASDKLLVVVPLPVPSRVGVGGSSSFGFAFPGDRERSWMSVLSPVAPGAPGAPGAPVAPGAPGVDLVEEESLTPPWDETSAASASYPSLPTRYRLWQCDAVVPGLPGTPFTTLEVCAVSAAAAAAAGYDARARRRRHRRPRAHGPVAMLAPGGVLSARGRPLELPGDLVHEWLWVPAAPLTRASEGATTEWTGVEDDLPQ